MLLFKEKRRILGYDTPNTNSVAFCTNMLVLFNLFQLSRDKCSRALDMNTADKVYSYCTFREETWRITEKQNNSPHTSQILSEAENTHIAKLIHWHCITWIPLCNLYLLLLVRFSFSPPHLWSPHTSETLGVIKKTEYSENIKTNLKLIGQDITIMSEGSELTNRVFICTTTHTDSEEIGSTKERWSW